MLKKATNSLLLFGRRVILFIGNTDHLTFLEEPEKRVAEISISLALLATVAYLIVILLILHFQWGERENEDEEEHEG